MVRAFADARGRYNLNMSEIAYGGIGKGEQSRRKMWAMAMGGAYIMVNGMDIATTAVGDLEDCGRMVRFFESAAVHRMAPHDELAHGATKYVLADPGEGYVGWCDDARGPVGFKQMKAGRYNLAWLDCTNGRQVVQRGVAVPGGDTAWPIPAGIGRELALHARLRGP
jgi:hypothetical protein